MRAMVWAVRSGAACALVLFSACAQLGSRPPVESLQRVARTVDLDGDGALSRAEVESASRVLPGLDANGDGGLDEYEMGGPGWVRGMLRLQPIIRVLDEDGSLFISRVEIVRAAQVLPQLDRDGDGIIRWDEATLSYERGDAQALGRDPSEAADLWVPRDMRRLLYYEDALSGPIPPGANRLADDGYLFYSESSAPRDLQVAQNAYLVAPDGSVVHSWDNPRRAPEGAGAYLREDGLLLRQSSASNWLGRTGYPAGAHGIIELVDWEGSVIWEWRRCEPTQHCLHHDMEPLPSGNVLVSSYEAFEREELRARGWLRGAAPERVWLESILEIEPNLLDGSREVVWRWNSWDHLVQDADPNKPDYAQIAESPERLDLNYRGDARQGPQRLFDINAISYDADLDQILVTSSAFSEVWVIDHSTTTEQAASGQGGRSGKGGRILYRWGNPAAYGAGDADDRVLYAAHDAHWLNPRLPNAGGNVLLHNNGWQRDLEGGYAERVSGVDTGFGSAYTDLLEIALPVGEDGRYPEPGGEGDAAEVVWRYVADPPESYYSPFLSSARRLPNGNTLTTVGYNKRIIEFTPQGKRVLDYFVPGPGQLYRVYKLPAEHPGLARLFGGGPAER